MKKKKPRLRVEDVRRRNLRRLKSETQMDWKEMAKLLGVSPSHMSQVMGGHRAFTEKTARKIEAALRLPRLALDRGDGQPGSHDVESVTDKQLLCGVQKAVTAALSAIGREEVERSARYERLIEFVYFEAKERGELDAARVGRLVKEALSE